MTKPQAMTDPAQRAAAKIAASEILDLLKNNLHALDDKTLRQLNLCRIEERQDPPVIEVHPEVDAAAAWWAECLRQPAIQDNGDFFQSALASIVSQRTFVPLADEEIEAFRGWLRVILMADIAASWDRNNPDWGSAVRGVHNDYHPDRVLCLAWRRACLPGEADNRFPIKTNMWINPGSVKVRAGYGAREEVIYSGEAAGESLRKLQQPSKAGELVVFLPSRHVKLAGA